MNLTILLTDEENNTLKKLLTKDFGYAPYNKNEAKKIIGEGKEYIIEITD